MTTLPALLSRVENASGPDREIDADIAVAFLPDAHAVERDASFRAESGTYWYFPPSRGRSLYTAERYTSSIDATIALAERVLPGCHWSITNAAMKPRANVWVPSPISRGRAPPPYSSAGTPALALLAAIIKAKMETARHD